MSSFKIIPIQNLANEPNPTDRLVLLQDGTATSADEDDILSALRNMPATKHVTVTTTTYTVADGIELVLADDDTAGAQIDITLPASPYSGQVVRIVKLGGVYDVTANVVGGITLSTQNRGVTCVSDGTNWYGF